MPPFCLSACIKFDLRKQYQKGEKYGKEVCYPMFKWRLMAGLLLGLPSKARMAAAMAASTADPSNEVALEPENFYYPQLLSEETGSGLGILEDDSGLFGEDREMEEED